MNWSLLWVLLLPVAAFSGWLVGRRGGARKTGHRVTRLSTTYFRGLNYLLTEQQDKALELFLQIAETDKDTIETQVALGHLFRRRGEIERAIRLHQGLVTRPGLSEQHKTLALLELGEDYMRAGLLDRAETLFSELVQADAEVPQALRHLISIYQAEREWQKAIDHARRYQASTGESMGRLVAQFHCELAEAARQRGDYEQAKQELAHAFAADGQSVRASLAEGRIEQALGNDAAAMRAFERVARLDVDYLPEILRPLLQIYENREDVSRAKAFLAEMIERHPGVSPILAMARIIEREEGRAAAAEFLSSQLRRRPSIRGQAALIEMSLEDGSSDLSGTLAALKQVTEQLIMRSPAYRCSHCGFGARNHHWQCPSCKNWGSVKPVHNLADA